MTAKDVFDIIRLIEDLTPEAIKLVKALLTSLKGKSDAEVAAMAHAINQATLESIQKELGGRH